MNLSTSSFKILFRRTALYLLLAVTLTYALREVMHYGIRMNKIGEFEQLNTIFIKKNNYDFIVAGSSRAESHFFPPMIDSILNFNSYNIGILGGNYTMTQMTLESYLQNSAIPEYVVMNIDFHDFRGENKVYNLHRYFPYLNNDVAFRNMNTLDNRIFWFKYNPFYSLASMNDRYLYASLRGFMNVEIEFDRSFVKGYVPIPNELADDFSSLNSKPYLSVAKNADSIAINDIITLCKKNKCKLIFILSPMYQKNIPRIINRKELLAYFEKLAKDNDIIWMNYIEHDLSKNIMNFRDPNHLSEKAAKEFTAVFADDLKEILKQNP